LPESPLAAAACAGALVAAAADFALADWVAVTCAVLPELEHAARVIARTAVAVMPSTSRRGRLPALPWSFIVIPSIPISP
jgi:hypothetical protein